MIIKFIFTLCFLIFCSNSYAYKIEVFYSQNHIQKKYSDTVNETLIHLTKNYHFRQDKNYNVFIDIRKENKRAPHTKISENSCDVNINLVSEKPTILENFKDDLQFLLVHELGHCYYGANHIFNKKIDFLFPIKNNLNLDDYESKVKKRKECLDCFQDLPFDPYVAYSELLSDIFTVNFFLETNKNYEDIILQIYNYRNKNFMKTQQNTNYISNIFIENFYLTDSFKKLNFEDVKFKAQETLIYFIENRVKK